MRIIFLILFCSSLSAFGQLDLARPITLEVENVSLEELFKTLETTYVIHVVYGTDNVPASTRISLNARDEPLSEIFHMISAQVGLSYQVINEVIVFQRLEGTASEELIRDQPPLVSDIKIMMYS